MRKSIPRNPTEKNIEYMWVLAYCWGHYVTCHQIGKALGRYNEHTIAKRSLARVCALGLAVYKLTPEGSMQFAITGRGMQMLKDYQMPNWSAEQVLHLAVLRKIKDGVECNRKEFGMKETK